MNTNCINCGAPIDINADKCSYCGTPYFDLTAIDFTSHKPVALRLKTYMGMDMGSERDATVTMLAYPRLGELTCEKETVDCYGNGTTLMRYIRNYNVNLGVNFDAVPARDGSMFNVYMKQ